MFCRNCGNEIDEKAVVCTNCGVAVANKKKSKSILKKWWFWVIVVVVIFAIIIPSGSGDSKNPSGSIEGNANSTNVEGNENGNASIREIKSGEKIVTNDMEIAVKGVELTYDVLPDDTSGFYTHYKADAGKVYISVDADVTNKAKQYLACDEIGEVTADYDNGYRYGGFIIVDDSSTGFTYANITDIAPLETKGIKWLISCPEEVEESQKPLYLVFTINGEKYKYTIR